MADDQHEHEHEGSYGEGVERTRHHPEADKAGAFAAPGRDDRVTDDDEHEGTFAEGQARDEQHPEHEVEGDFAEGQEADDRPRRSDLDDDDD